MAFSPFNALAKRASVHTPTAVDETAVRVVFYPGDTYDPPTPRVPSNGQDLPPRALSAGIGGLFVEFQGQRRGRITALHFWGYSGKGKVVFLVRCDCGRYAFRKIVKWASNADHSDNCGVCEKVGGLSHRNRSRERSGLRRAVWIASMLEAGITAEQCAIIEKYSLDTDDLQWLKGALAEIESRIGGQ